MRSRPLVLLLTLSVFLLIMSCANRPTYMQHEVVFYAEIGSGPNQVGANLDIMSNAIQENPGLFINDFIDMPTSCQVFRKKIYLVDKYNKRISVFPFGNKPSSSLIINSKGDGYEFDTPFQIVLNRYEEMFVLARASYTELTNKKYTNLSPADSFFIYKFSPDGKLIYEIGANGIQSEPMQYPDRIDIDLFNNLYVYFRDQNETSGRNEWMVKRYSPSGELSFEFNTRYVSPTNVVDGVPYVGFISDIYNLKNDERLLIYSDNYNIINKLHTNRSTGAVSTNLYPKDFFLSLDVYSILQNAITKNIFRSRKHLEGFLGVTGDDIVVFYTYDDRFDGIRLRFVDILEKNQAQEEIYYAPMLAEAYRFGHLFLDNNGMIYTSVMKDNFYVILRWKKVRSRVN